MLIMLLAAVLGLGTLAVLPPAPAGLQDGRTVVTRLRAYVDRFEQEAVAFVAEEQYEQQLIEARASAPQVRMMRSDYVLVRPADTTAWLGYRDVFDVDGKLLREREARLVDILSGTASDSLERAAALVREGSRFNLGPERTVNTPLMPMQLLARRHAGRMVLRPGRIDRRNGTAVVSFYEPNAPTIVRTPDGRNVWSHGEVTSRLSDGAIVRAVVRFRLAGARERDESVMRVAYAQVPGIPVLLPLHMREDLTMGVGSRASGEATYSNYRRFQTSARIR